MREILPVVVSHDAPGELVGAVLVADVERCGGGSQTLFDGAWHDRRATELPLAKIEIHPRSIEKRPLAGKRSENPTHRLGGLGKGMPLEGAQSLLKRRHGRGWWPGRRRRWRRWRRRRPDHRRGRDGRPFNPPLLRAGRTSRSARTWPRTFGHFRTSPSVRERRKT